MSRFDATDLTAALRELPTDTAAYANELRRVRARLAEHLVGSGGDPRGTPSARVAPVPSSGPAASGLRAARVSRTIAAAIVGGTLVVGAVAGVGAEHWLKAPRRIAVAPVAATSDATSVANAPGPAPSSAPIELRPGVELPSLAGPASATPSESSPPAIAAIGAPKTKSTESATISPKVATPEVASLSEEERLLDLARTALTRGEPQAGLAPLARHEARFPNGQLVEEREALYVRILVALERDEEATVRATAFRRRFPDSLFKPVVDNALATISRRTDDTSPKP
jgi:hypothetical protein